MNKKIEKAIELVQRMSDDNKRIWNAAMEAAAYMLENTNLNDKDDAEEVRKLKVK